MILSADLEAAPRGSLAIKDLSSRQIAELAIALSKMPGTWAALARAVEMEAGDAKGLDANGETKGG